MGDRILSPWAVQDVRRHLSMRDSVHRVRSRVVGEGTSTSPEGPPPSTGSVRGRSERFADALHKLCHTLVDAGVMSFYAEHLSNKVLLDYRHELNARIAELVSTTETGAETWHDDVDEVFRAVHEVANEALPVLQARDSPTDDTSSGLGSANRLSRNRLTSD